MKKTITSLVLATAIAVPAAAQQYGLVDMRNSNHAVMVNTTLGATQWTGGFWKERFDVFHKASIPSMYKTWKSKEGKGWNNFLLQKQEFF